VWPAIGPEHAALEVLRRGVQLDGAKSTPTLPARVEIAQQQPDDGLYDSETTVLRISLQQGQYRQVRTCAEFQSCPQHLKDRAEHQRGGMWVCFRFGACLGPCT